MLNILVCIKQVPDTTNIKIDPVTNTLIREGVPSIVNPFDAYALELAVRLKEQAGGTVTAVSMGPPQARRALQTCLAKGADQACLMTDRAVGGSDTLATSYILSCVARKLGPFDVIFCGKQAIDGDTGQVGPEMAQHLGLPQITHATAVDYRDGALQVRRESDDGWEVVGTSAPALITVTKTDQEPRMATLRSTISAGRAVIEEIHCADIADMDMTRVGLKGSPTKVSKTFVPDRGKHGILIQGKSPEDSARELVGLLGEQHLIS